ncbi:carbohydrate ABC transporter permease [Spongisporangium articulatum]|uniref:Carbohydrate ABC transporter permease n=1 Tax=Spongisporangium articulatum TaxID=3362603 RepID=A0ABW8AJJ0_9ACTN
MTTTAQPIPVETEPKQSRFAFGRKSRYADPGGAHWSVKLAVLLICFFWIVPAFGTLVTSFRTEGDANGSGWWTVFNPAKWDGFTLSNYHDAIVNAKLGEALINSFAIALPATFIPILIAAFAAYAFSFMQFWGRDVIFFALVSFLVVPNLVALVPILKLYSSYGLNGSFPAVWLFHIGFGMSLAIFLFRNYMSTLPREVIESAKVDGASHYATFYRLIIPMSTPVLASFAIFQFLWVWNDLLVALVFIGPGDNAPLTVSVKNNLIGQQGQGWNLVTAGGILTMIVPIIVFLALQRYFVRGLTAGSVKG